MHRLFCQERETGVTCQERQQQKQRWHLASFPRGGEVGRSKSRGSGERHHARAAQRERQPAEAAVEAQQVQAKAEAKEVPKEEKQLKQEVRQRLQKARLEENRGQREDALLVEETTTKRSVLNSGKAVRHIASQNQVAI